MVILPEAILQYAERHSTPPDALLQQVLDYTTANHPKAHMLSGPLQGKFLELISVIIRPRRILEIGTFTGYSALCLAKGLAIDGELNTLELRESDATVAQGFFNRSPQAQQIKLHIGEAAHIIGQLDEVWDLVFIDADKVGYIQYFDLILPKLRPNGIIFADNTLFHGEVLEPELKGKNAKAMQAFNEYLRQRNDIEIVLLPLRDGLTMIRKL